MEKCDFKMKKIIMLLGLFLLVFTTAFYCSGENMMNNNVGSTSIKSNRDVINGKRILVAYFSRADENTRVGYIEKGNTRILAEMVADITKGDLFEIKTIKSYPKEYRPATLIARMERENNERPEIVEPLPDMDKYDVIFLGYPIWWRDMPMGVYTFLEKENFSDKIIIPFCTHEGSGIGDTGEYIRAVTNAKVLFGLEMRGSKAQHSRDEARADVEQWVNKSLSNIK